MKMICNFMNLSFGSRYESSEARIPPPRGPRRIIMTRAKYVLLPTICALAFTVGTPAMALNPQPLPPGFKAPTSFQAGKNSARKAGGYSGGTLISQGNKSHGQ
jgi:hypothetical protein